MYPTNIVVYSSGDLNWVPLGLYISSCSINIKWFPFDDQLCTMKFGSWTYDGSKINLTARIATIDVSNYQPSGEWDLIGKSGHISQQIKWFERGLRLICQSWEDRTGNYSSRSYILSCA